MKYTKGTWNLSHSPSDISMKKGVEGRIYKSVKTQKNIGGKIIANAYGDNKEEAESNAKLIASAPELLEALLDIVNWNMLGENEKHPIIKRAKGVIKKATE